MRCDANPHNLQKPASGGKNTPEMKTLLNPVDDYQIRPKIVEREDYCNPIPIRSEPTQSPEN